MEVIGAARVRMALGTASVELHLEFFRKLRRLYRLTRLASSAVVGGGDGGGDGDDSANDSDGDGDGGISDEAFVCAAFCMMCRYSAVGLHNRLSLVDMD